MNLLNKELKDLREEQTKIRAEAVQETEAKSSKVIKELEEKLEAALAVEQQKREAAEDSLEVGKREEMEAKASTEVEDLMVKNRDLEQR